MIDYTSVLLYSLDFGFVIILLRARGKEKRHWSPLQITHPREKKSKLDPQTTQ